MLQQAIANMLETNDKVENLDKEVEDMKKNQMKILELKKQYQKSTPWMGLIAELRGQRKESVNIKIEK